MFRIQKIIILALFGGVLFSAKLLAQDSIPAQISFDYIKHKEGWFASDNASGLHALSVSDVSVAEVYFNKSNGKFVNYFESSNSHQFGAKAESYFRLSPKVVLYGYVNYHKFIGQNMNGSIFIDPYYMPFNIVEMGDDDAGKKELETYHLIGAISAEVYKGLRLGGKIDYKAGNYAKMKDLRHKNILMDMFFTVGASYQIIPMIEIGANYFYRRNTEGISFGSYGNKDKKYISLIDFGAFYGRAEEFNSSGYTKMSGTRPVVNEFNGGALQLNIKPIADLELFNEFSYKSRSGYYGKKSDITPQYTRHSGKILEYQGQYSLKVGNNLHVLNVMAQKDELENYEKIFKSVTTENGVSIYEYYGETLMNDRKQTSLGVHYIANIGIEENNPTWVFRGGMNYLKREQAVSVFPYFRKQNIDQYMTSASGQRSFFSGKKIYTISLGGTYTWGSGLKNKDGVYVTPSDKQESPESADFLLDREYEYLTASRVGGNVGFRFDMPITPKTFIYTSLDVEVTKAMDVQYLKGDSYLSATIKIGCSF